MVESGLMVERWRVGSGGEWIDGGECESWWWWRVD